MTDLHTHSTFSDGTKTPADLVASCPACGVEILSLTDHDTTGGIEEAVAAGRKNGVLVIPGIELSCETDREIHILGYNFDYRDRFFSEEIEALREERKSRTVRMIAKLNELGAGITYEDVLAHARGDSIGRPHIGAALVQKGFAAGMQEAFEKYLQRGAPAYVPRVKMTPEKAVKLILNAGGVPVLAHPLLTGFGDIRPLVAELKSYGLMGIEAYYPAHTDGQCAEYESIAMQNGLLVTSGSDFHGPLFEAQLGGERRKSSYLEKSVEKIVGYKGV
jgi:predicted metal-dependent phosphoesterase TrpH